MGTTIQVLCSHTPTQTHTHTLPFGTYTHVMLHKKLYALLNTRIQNSNFTSVRTSELNAASDFDLAILLFSNVFVHIHTQLYWHCVVRYMSGKCSIFYLSIRFYNSCRRLPETNRHFSMFLHRSGSIFLVVMAACTSPIQIFLGRPLLFLSSVIDSIINFGIVLFWVFY